MFSSRRSFLASSFGSLALSHLFAQGDDKNGHAAGVREVVADGAGDRRLAECERMRGLICDRIDCEAASGLERGVRLGDDAGDAIIHALGGRGRGGIAKMAIELCGNEGCESQLKTEFRLWNAAIRGGRARRIGLVRHGVSSAGCSACPQR